jgi:hypothetical protein
MTQHDLRGKLVNYIRQPIVTNTYVDCKNLFTELEQVCGHDSNRLRFP